MNEGFLSDHLSVAEFISTNHRDFIEEQEFLWNGTPALRDNAQRFAVEVFEPVRKVLGVPLHVNSGLRSPGLNAAVGGALRSRHLLGLACDVTPVGLNVREAIFAILHAMRRGELPHLDKAIVEFGRWIHLQAANGEEPARQLVLESEDGREFARLA